jgi:acyl carrier protein
MVPAMTDEIVKKVREIVAEETCTLSEQVTLETTFAELGVDSLDFLHILAEVRDKVGPVEDTFITIIEKVGDLAAAVGAKCDVL